MISLQYFSVQKLTFAGVGIHLMSSDSKSPQRLIKHPLLLYGILLSSFFHLILVAHYAYVHISDFMKVTDSVPLLCQLVLCLSKMVIFLSKRLEIHLLIREVHKINYQAQHEEMLIVQRENAKDNFLCTIFFRLVVVTGSFAILHPVIYGLYIYFSSGEIILTESFKASVFWDLSNLAGYSLLYVINISTSYFSCVVSLAFDTLFFWFVSNIVAQFHIIGHRLNQLAVQHTKLVANSFQQQFYARLVSCIQYHCQTLFLAHKLNHIYGEIIFIKFIVVCTEICSLVYQISRPSDSLAELVFKIFFLSAVALQLMLYCWNGQRIKDESLQVATAIYCAFDWSSLPKSCQQLLMLSMQRSQRCNRVRGLFFEVDLRLYLWVFKTAGSLLTAIKTLEENQA